MFYNFLRHINVSAHVLLIVAVTSVTTFAQPLLELHPIKKDEKRTFESSRIKSDYMYDSLYATTSFNYNISLHAADATSEETILEWVYTSASSNHKVIKKTPKQYIIANALEYLTRKLYGFKSLKIIYSTDAAGSFKELKNIT